MRRTRHVVLPVKSWQYMGLMVVSLACLTLGLVSRDRGGKSGSLAGPELKHTAPHEVDACPNLHYFNRMAPYDDPATPKGPYDSLRRTRTTISTRSVRNSNAMVPPAIESSMLGREKRSIQDRQSIVTDRGMRTIETSRGRLSNSRGQNLKYSKFMHSDEDRNLLIREKRSRFSSSTSETTNRRNRESNRYADSFKNRLTDSRLQEFREKLNVIIGGRKMNFRNNQAAPNNRRSSEISSIREIGSERQRLQSRSYDRRSTGSRENGVTRNRLDERRSSERRIDDSEQRMRNTRVELRRNIRAANVRDTTTNDNRSFGMSRSSDNRLEQRIDNRRYDAQLGRQNAEDRQRRSNLVAKRSNDIRENMNIRRVGIRSEERVSSERRDMNNRQHRDNRSEERNSMERRNRNQLQRQKSLRNEVLGKSRKIQNHRTSSDDRLDFRRVNIRSQERRVSTEPASERFENTERRTARLGRVHEQSRHGDSTRRVIEQRLSIRSNQRQKPSSLPARVEQRRTSGSEVAGQRAWVDSLRRNVRITRETVIQVYPVRNTKLDNREISQQRRSSNSNVLLQRRTSEKGREIREASQERRQRSTERTIARELRTSDDGRETSRERQRRQASGINSLQRRNVQHSRMSRIMDMEHPENLAIHDASLERRGRFVERATVRPNNRMSRERREPSEISKLVARTSRVNHAQDVRRTLKNERSKFSERGLTRDVSQERREQVSERSIARELGNFNDNRESSAMRKDHRDTSRVGSLERRTKTLQIARNTDPEIRQRLAVRDASEERRVYSNDRSVTSIKTSRERTTMINIRGSLGRNDRKIVNERSRTNFLNIADFSNGAKVSTVKNNEYLHQALILVLCAVYGASLLKDKGGSYGFGKIIAPVKRYVVW